MADLVVAEHMGRLYLAPEGTRKRYRVRTGPPNLLAGTPDVPVAYVGGPDGSGPELRKSPEGVWTVTTVDPEAPETGSVTRVWLADAPPESWSLIGAGRVTW